MLKFLLLFLAVCSSPVSLGQDRTSQAHSTVQFITDHDVVRPGESFFLGLLVKLEPHWHSYWENPGDSGAAPLLDLILPDGLTSGPLLYAVPQRIPVGPLMSFGYEYETLYMYEVNVASGHSTSQDLLLKISAEWLVCKEECIPAFFDFSKTISIGEKSIRSETHNLFSFYQNTISDEIAQAQFAVEGDYIRLEVRDPNETLQGLIDVIPFPGSLVTNDEPHLKVDANQIEILLRHEGGDPGTSLNLLGIVEQNQKTKGIKIVATKSKESLWTMVLLAFGGGLLLNLMPCVFPILTLKLFSFLKASQESHGHLIKSQLVYLSGILVSFWIIAGILFALRSGGDAVGWGFQMQNPWFVGGLALLFALLGMNFIGSYEFSGRWSGVGHSLTQGEGTRGTFFTGVLAVVVASPCTAPFMGAALGFAASQTFIEMVLIFTFLGLGLGFPYVALALIPSAGRWLPKPGTWMVALKEFMAFPMWGTSLWLLYILNQLAGMMSVVLVASSLLGVIFAWWTWKRLDASPLAKILLLVSLEVVVPLGLYHSVFTERAESMVWEEFSVDKLNSVVGGSRPVFVNFTATWCISCQVNDQTTFRDPEVQGFVKDKNILMMKADWTNRDSEIRAILEDYGRIGVPLYLYFPSGTKRAKVLPEILSPDIFVSQTSH